MNLMLCETAKSEADIPNDFIPQRKFDGIRCLYFNCSGEKLFFNRYGKNITADFKEIKISDDFKGIFDGEVIVLTDKEGVVEDFNLLQNHKSNKSVASYVVFDILQHNGQNTTKLKLTERLALLLDIATHIKLKSENLLFISDIPTPTWAEVERQKLEGLIYKNPNSLYEFKRSKNWVKKKAWKETTGEIESFEISDSLGFTIEFKPNVNPAITQRVAVQNPEARTFIQNNYGKKQLFANVQYLEITKDDRLRMPTFKGFENA